MRLHDDDPIDVVDRQEYQSGWFWVVAIIVVIVLAMYAPSIYRQAVAKAESTWQQLQRDYNEFMGNTGLTVVKPDTQKRPSQSSPLDQQVTMALQLDRQGDRVEANELYQLLLARKSQLSERKRVLLMAYAADFYGRGEELPIRLVEAMYRDAYAEIKRVYQHAWPYWERFYLGWENFEVRSNNYDGAISRVNLLQNYYSQRYLSAEARAENRFDPQRYYTLYNELIQRKARYLVKTGQIARAKTVLNDAIVFLEKKNVDTSGLVQLQQAMRITGQ